MFNVYTLFVCLQTYEIFAHKKVRHKCMITILLFILLIVNLILPNFQYIEHNYIRLLNINVIVPL